MSAPCDGPTSDAEPDSSVQVDAEPYLHEANPLWSVRPADVSSESVRLRFVVRPNGRVAPRTLRVDGTDDRRWVMKARRWLMRTRFIPVTRDGCPVAQWMSLAHSYGRSQ